MGFANLDLDMGKYALFVWGSYGLSLVAIAGLIGTSLLTHRRRKAVFEALQQAALSETAAMARPDLKADERVASAAKKPEEKVPGLNRDGQNRSVANSAGPKKTGSKKAGSKKDGLKKVGKASRSKADQ